MEGSSDHPPQKKITRRLFLTGLAGAAAAGIASRFRPHDDDNGRRNTLPTSNPSPTESSQSSAKFEGNPFQTATEIPTEVPTQTPTNEPSMTPQPTKTPTEEPTRTPELTPTEHPTQTPTHTATREPSSTATQTPSQTPTETRTEIPTETPTQTPTQEPSITPQPTEEPTQEIDDKEIDKDTVDWLTKIYKDKLMEIPSFSDIDEDGMPTTDNSKNLYTENDVREFFKELTRIATHLNKDNINLANQLAACINFESGFSTYISNQAGTSDAVGLIQFCFPENIDTTREELQNMTPLEQLTYVEKYFNQACDSSKLWDVSDVYMAILAPGEVGSTPDHIIYIQGDGNYEANASVLDPERKGYITKEMATVKVITEATPPKGNEKLEYLHDPRVKDTEIENSEIDKHLMEKLVKANNDLIANPPQWVKDNTNNQWGNGWCLYGVRLSVEQVFPTFNELGKDQYASQATDSLRSSDRFTELKLDLPPTVTDENMPSFIEKIKDCPEGTIIVYNPGVDNFDMANNIHAGHIAILKYDENGNPINGSDHDSKVADDLTHLRNGISGIFVIKKDDLEQASTAIAESTSNMQPTEDKLGFIAPEEFNDIQSIKDALGTKFSITIDTATFGVDYDLDHYRFLWEKLWATSQTKFPELIKNLTIRAIPGANSQQMDPNTIQLGVTPAELDFKALFTHESGHIIYNRHLDQLQPQIQKVYETEAGISPYGDEGYSAYISTGDTARAFHEDMADTIMYKLNPKYNKLSKDLTTPYDNPLYSGKNDRPLHEELADEILLTDYLLKKN